jgi:hypothetical protein
MNLGKLSQRFVASVVTLGVAGVLLVMAPQSASAQGIIVSNQFPFSADKQQYPAGTYQFTLESLWLLSIRNTDGGYKNFFAVRPEDSGPLGSRGRLTFYNCEGHEKLEAVFIPGTDVTARLVGPATATTDINAHGRRARANCQSEKGPVRERIAKGQ